MAAPLNDSHEAHRRLVDALRRVDRLHARRAHDPALHAALGRLATWQSRRLRNTYADLASQPRYGEAIRFFEQDLYGAPDLAARDRDLAGVVPMLVRVLPARVLATIADAVALNAMSHELDEAMVGVLGPCDPPPDVVAYCRAYRAVGRPRDRERQIELIGVVGNALDAHVRKPLVRAALAAMRGPAHAMGFGALQEFLERGFRAFRAMDGAGDFLATVLARERELMIRIFAGDDAPFPPPAQ